MKLTTTLMTIAIASAVMLQSACKSGNSDNPLLEESQLPFGAPDFSKIKTSDYLPAFEVAIQQTRDNIQAIVDRKD